MSEDAKRHRGRPRKFDYEEALTGAMTTFWCRGIDGTSYDDLVDAMDMNRPSIYRAFGNKEAIYKLSLELFGKQVIEQVKALSDSERTLKEDIDLFLEQGLEVYCEGEQPKGCFIACTAVADAIVHPSIKGDLVQFIESIDECLENRFRKAQEHGELSGDADCKLMAASVQGVLHTLAVRARAGQDRKYLSELKSFYLDQWF